MSRENVDAVRRIYDAWDRAESARDFISPDVEYVTRPTRSSRASATGARSFRVVRETYEDFSLAVERYLDAGGDDVVVLARYTASGRGSGVQLEGEHGYVWTIRDGLAVRFRWFQSHREAFEAAGLEPGA
jgi:ketosteroid isomerase-like protein